MTAISVKEKSTETVIDAVHRVSISLDLDEVMETIFDSLKEMLDYSAAVICVVDSRDGVLYRLRTRGYSPDSITEDFFASGRGVIGWVIKHGRGVIINDVKDDTRYVQARPETRSEIAAPIVRHDDKVIGGINLESDRPSAYDRRARLATGDRTGSLWCYSDAVNYYKEQGRINSTQSNTDSGPQHLAGVRTEAQPVV